MTSERKVDGSMFYLLLLTWITHIGENVKSEEMSSDNAYTIQMGLYYRMGGKKQRHIFKMASIVGVLRYLHFKGFQHQQIE